MKQNPFNHSHFIGYINQVSPQFVKIHFPSSILMKSFSFYGEDLKGGLVGSYVVIEGEKYGFLGKILELSLPEKERLELSEKSFNTKDIIYTGNLKEVCSYIHKLTKETAPLEITNLKLTTKKISANLVLLVFWKMVK